MTTTRPFRFGVSARASWEPDAWRRLARTAEATGYSTLLLADHLTDMFPPLLPLASAAEITSTLRFGTFVLNNDFHHPAWLAREAATLDALTGGRFELGMGAGHMKSEYDEVGLQFDAAGARVDRLIESVDLVRRLLAGEAVTHEGEHYRLDEHRCFPVPEQLVERRERFGISYVVVFEPAHLSLAPVVEELAGR